MTIGLPLLLTLATQILDPVTPPPAQEDEARNWALCDNDDRRATPEAVVAACTALLESVGSDPLGRSRALSGRAIGYRSLDDPARAIADYEAALRIDPNYTWAHAGLGASYRDQRDYPRSIAEYDIALRLIEAELAASPDEAARAAMRRRSAFGYYGRAESYEALDDKRGALADYRIAFERAPDEPIFGNSLCWSLAVLNENLDEARAACDASLRVRPNHPPTLDSRGLVGLRQGRFQEAWNDYDAAVRISPGGPSWVYGRGIAALRLGRTEEGRADIARATALNAEVVGFYADFGIRP